MYSKFPEGRRQKPVRASTFKVENERNQEAMPQYFQISVNVIEARKLAWSNQHLANSYVVVMLGKKKYRTSICKNTIEPTYKACFTYEMYTSIQDLQKLSLWLAVMEPRCCALSRIIGEAKIHIGTIWAQPHHHMFHKWAQLVLPNDPSSGAVGFVKVDISISSREETQIMPILVNQAMVEYPLLPTSLEQQKANYLITVYAAFGLSSGTLSHNERRNGKLPSTFVRASFCGLVAKTAVQHRNKHPIYSEQVSFVEMFPNLCQLVQLEVCSAEGHFNRILANTRLKLESVSHDGENGFLPTFGPSLLHMYGTSSTNSIGGKDEDGPFYRGALLVSLRTIAPYYQGVQQIGSTSVEPVTPIETSYNQQDNLWTMEDFVIYCPIFEVSMLDPRISGKICGVAITIGEIYSGSGGDEDFSAMQREIKSQKLHYSGSLDVVKSNTRYGYLDFHSGYPVLQVATQLPDFRHRIYRNNMVFQIVTDLESSAIDVEHRLKNFEYLILNDLIDTLNKALNDAAGKINKFLNIFQYSGPSYANDDLEQGHTELDHKQLALQKEEMEKVYQNITQRSNGGSTNYIQKGFSAEVNRKSVKKLLAEVKTVTKDLSKVIFKTYEGWPDIVLWMLSRGSRVAYTKIPTAEVIHSIIEEQNGRNCGRIQTVYMKPIKCSKHMKTQATHCYCIAGKIELLLWMGLYRQSYSFFNCLPNGLKISLSDYEMIVKATVLMLEYRVFIYSAKINNSTDNSTSKNIFVRLNAINSVMETKAIEKTHNPVWNQVLRIQTRVLTSIVRIATSPPLAVIEVYESDVMNKTNLIGRFEAQPVVDDRPSLEHAPKLQWYEMYKGVEPTGQVLMSVQLLQIPEKLMKTTTYSPIAETFYASGVEEYDPYEEQVERLPKSITPESTTYKIDVYWWGLRDVTITRKPCVALQIDELVIKSDIICDKCTCFNFPNGRTSRIFEGPLNGTLKPNLSVKLYDSGTFGRTLFVGTSVLKNPYKFVVNWLPKYERGLSLKSASIISSAFKQINYTTFVKKNSPVNLKCGSNVSVQNSSEQMGEAKQSAWRRIFSINPAEEEYVLLPTSMKEKDQRNAVEKRSVKKDWWSRYFCSQRDYDSEDKAVGFDKIVYFKIYESELELQPEFSKFKDWSSTLKLYNGTRSENVEKDDRQYCGLLKIGIAIYKWPPPNNTVAVSCSGVELNNGYFDGSPSNKPSKFLVRVYLVRGIDFKMKDFTGQLNPYIILNCGKKRLGNREHFVENSLNPVFGRMYEFQSNLPDDYLLTISFYHYEANQTDELIGTTNIDIEDRIYTKHRARIGLSTDYSIDHNQWRDCAKPSKILEELCSKNHLAPPVYIENAAVVVNGIEYRDNDDKTSSSSSERKENICLTILQNWQTMPICGYHLVPEHVETRTLYSYTSKKSGTEQGKIQMWVDIYPLSAGTYIPPPVDITPRVVEDYELRLIVWEVQQLRLEPRKVADIYVKGWIGSEIYAQNTEILYRYSNGKGYFNWQMIFDFTYQFVGRKVIAKRNGLCTEYEELLQPIVVLRVKNTDTALSNEFIGTLTFDINALPKGENEASQCTLEAMQMAKKISLFSVSSIRGWWPFWTIENEKTILAGVVDLELTLLTKEQAMQTPVSLGRNSSNHLLFSLTRHEVWELVKWLVFVAILILFIYLAVFSDIIPEVDLESIIREKRDSSRIFRIDEVYPFDTNDRTN